MAGGSFSHVPKEVELVETKYRKINTKIPVPESISLINRMYALESRSMHGQYPIIWDKAENFQVSDKWGNVWIDFTSTIFVANVGHSNNRIVRKLQNCINKPLLHTYTYASHERVEYLDYLMSMTPSYFEKAFLLSAGTEATEAALKLMRLNAIQIGKKGGVICFEGSYHGRTMGAQSMTGSKKAKEWIGYQDPNIFHLPFPYPWEVKNPKVFFQDTLRDLLNKNNIDPKNDICGIMLETFQGWGAIFYPKEYVKALFDFAHENDILVAFDEMQAGFGRTGKLFGYEHYDVEPDLICCGKGASSGLPLAIVLGSKKVMDLPGVGSMSSTHSANPLVCVAGHANLEALFEDNLLKNSQILGRKFHDRLNEIKGQFPNHVRFIFGFGLLAAIIFVDDNGKPLTDLCDAVCEKAFQRGLLLVHTGRESIKLAPPLSISEEAMMEGVDVLEMCIKDSI
jgi:4-aminobutyrate aminotransferase-like enzyme